MAHGVLVAAVGATVSHIIPLALRGGSPASAGDEVATNAAPAARHEKEQQMGKHGKSGEERANVLQLLRLHRGDGFSVADVAEALDIARGSATYQLNNLVADDELLVSCDLGYKVYRARHEFGEDDPAPVPPQALAPVLPPPERPANVEAAPDRLPAQAGPPLFAGLNTIFYVPPRDHEAAAIEECVRQLDDLDRPARDRVWAYLASRFMAEWPDKAAGG